MAFENLTNPIPDTAQATQFEISTFHIDFAAKTVHATVSYKNPQGMIIRTRSFTGSFTQFGIDATMEANLITKIKTRLMTVGGIN